MDSNGANPPIDEDPETKRLRALYRLGILDTPAGDLLDSLTRSAAAACGTPVALVNLVDRRRQWTKSLVGLPPGPDLPREEAVCTLVVEARTYLEIPDLHADPRVAQRRGVRELPDFAFYAGMPLRTPDGEVLGSLCVLDKVARDGLEPGQRAALGELAHAVMQALLVRQAAQQALQSSSEQTFRALSENCPIGIFHTDARGRIIYLNAETVRIFGRPRETLLGGDWVRWMHPDDGPAVGAAWRQAAASLKLFGRTFRLRLEGRGDIYVRVRAQPMVLPDGSPGGYVGSVEDVTDSVLAHAALERSQERLQRALQGSELSLWDLDVPARQVYLSEQWSLMRGGPAQETRCTSAELLDVAPPEDHPLIVEALRPVLAGESAHYAVQHRVRRHDGSMLWIHSEGRVAEHDAQGMPLRMVGINRDITQHRRTVEQLQEARDAADAANQAKSLFLATMSHEIRTPLNGIVGMTKLLLDEPLQPEVRRHADLIDRSAHSLLALVNDILDVSKIEAGQMEIERVAFDLHELLDDLGTLYRLRATEKSLLFRVRRAPDVPQLVEGDPTRIRQVLVNLLGNALKFTRTGWIGLDVKWRAGDAGQVLEFGIVDTGIGIPEEVQSQLFTRFMQADSSTSRRFGGTGLGLSIVRQLVDLMGGSVSVHSAPGKGSRFTVRLPAALAEEVPAFTAWQDLPPPTQGTRVLVAEDNPTNQVVAFGMLRKLGYDDVTIAHDGVEACRLALDQRFDVILMDCQMPEMDGYEATRRLRAAGCTSSIVAMTANAIQGDRERCIEAGMNDYLTKPIDIRQLRAALARWSGAPSSQLGELPLFHAESMHSRFGGDTDLEQLALTTFRQTTPPLLARLRAAVEAGNRPQAKLLAHSAKGGASMISAQRYAAIAGCIEEQADEGPQADLARLVADMQRAFDEFEAIVAAR